MDDSTLRPPSPQHERHEDSRSYQAPTVEVISLDCEISAYAPDEGDAPLF